MTVIVGIEHADGVTIGGDAAAVNGFRIGGRGNGKVFRNGPYLIGSAGSHRMNQLLRYKWEPPKLPRAVANGSIDDEALLTYLIRNVVPKWRELFKDGGLAERKNNIEAFSGRFLMGIAGRLFIIGPDYQVWDPLHPYWAIGAGEEIALGSLFTVMRDPALSTDPEQVALEALAAADEFSGAVRGPFVVQTA